MAIIKYWNWSEFNFVARFSTNCNPSIRANAFNLALHFVLNPIRHDMDPFYYVHHLTTHPLTHPLDLPLPPWNTE